MDNTENDIEDIEAIIQQANGILLFPTVAMEFDLSEKLGDCSDMVEKYIGSSHSLMENGSSNYSAAHTEKLDWLGEERTAQLVQAFQECVDTYARRMNLFPLTILNFWMNSMSHGGRTILHRHEGSVLSAAFYPKVAEGSARLKFHSPLRPYRMNELFEAENDLNTYYHYIEPKDGHLVIFPSWLDHETEINNTDYRYVISFNTARIN